MWVLPRKKKRMLTLSEYEEQVRLTPVSWRELIEQQGVKETEKAMNDLRLLYARTNADDWMGKLSPAALAAVKHFLKTGEHFRHPLEGYDLLHLPNQEDNDDKKAD
jgi:hypothetical protein